MTVGYHCFGSVSLLLEESQFHSEWCSNSFSTVGTIYKIQYAKMLYHKIFIFD